jgi:tRNA G18 (ribose-2'-O)-methylase SpoU
MNIVPVTDPDDVRLTDYVALTDVDLRRRREPAEGLFVAEGEKVIRRAIAAGYPVRSMLLDEKWRLAMADLVDSIDAPVYVGEPALLEHVTGFHVHRGALAVMQRRLLPSVDEVLATARRVVVLEDINDHTNIGAIFRAAAGLGMDAVLLAPRCADPLYRRAVKVSMGAVFSVPHARLNDWYHTPDRLRTAGFRVLALTPDPQAVPIDEVRPHSWGRDALLFGAEGTGLSARWLASADLRVRIPMSRGVDSLNVAAAAAVAFYALTRALSTSPGRLPSGPGRGPASS